MSELQNMTEFSNQTHKFPSIVMPRVALCAAARLAKRTEAVAAFMFALDTGKRMLEKLISEKRKLSEWI